MKINRIAVETSGAAAFIFLKVLPVLIPIIVFFVFNMLTPFWWDDFIMGCFFTDWHIPHTALLSSFSDVVVSTYNMYQTWHGRSTADFLNFLFMFFKDKNIFNICNTIVYGIFVLLIGFHVKGSFKKISALLFMFINILLWFFLSTWGQNLLWLTGSCNYLWTTTLILLFLLPFRKKAEDLSYRPNIVISFLWIIVGVLAGWSLENSASGVFVLLTAYFVLKRIKKEPAAVFEISGSIGFMFGLFMLLRARENLFPGFYGLLKNTFMVGFSFILNDAFLLGLIVLLAIELIYFRKIAIPKTIYGFFLAALASVAAMIIPGRLFDTRVDFITQVFLIIVLLSLAVQLKQLIPRKYTVIAGIVLLLAFIPSFYSGTKAIVSDFLYAEARERYIRSEIKKGNIAIKTKTPIPISDSHSGLYGSIDILDIADVSEHIAHNSAKITWYGIESLEGIPTLKKGILTESVVEFIERRKTEGLGIDDLFIIIYDDW